MILSEIDCVCCRFMQEVFVEQVSEIFGKFLQFFCEGSDNRNFFLSQTDKDLDTIYHALDYLEVRDFKFPDSSQAVYPGTSQSLNSAPPVSKLHNKMQRQALPNCDDELNEMPTDNLHDMRKDEGELHEPQQLASELVASNNNKLDDIWRKGEVKVVLQELPSNFDKLNDMRLQLASELASKLDEIRETNKVKVKELESELASELASKLNEIREANKVKVQELASELASKLDEIREDGKVKVLELKFELASKLGKMYSEGADQINTSSQHLIKSGSSRLLISHEEDSSEEDNTTDFVPFGATRRLPNSSTEEDNTYQQSDNVDPIGMRKLRFLPSNTEEDNTYQQSDNVDPIGMERSAKTINCYFNSVIQCFFAQVDLRRDTLNQENNEASPILQKLARLFKWLEQQENTPLPPKAQRDFGEGMNLSERILYASSDEMRSNFVYGVQGDADEVFRALTSLSVGTEILFNAHFQFSVKTVRRWWISSMNDGGCDYENASQEFNLSWMLPLQRGSPQVMLTDLIENYLELEIIDADAMIYVDESNPNKETYQKGSVVKTISTFPKVLVFTFGRYEYEQVIVEERSRASRGQKKSSEAVVEVVKNFSTKVLYFYPCCCSIAF